MGEETNRQWNIDYGNEALGYAKTSLADYAACKAKAHLKGLESGSIALQQCIRGELMIADLIADQITSYQTSIQKALNEGNLEGMNPTASILIDLTILCTSMMKTIVASYTVE